MTLLILFFLACYFLPTLVGWNKKNSGAIFALNFFLGWTVVGWIIALVWALSSDREPTHIVVYQTAGSSPSYAAACCPSCSGYSPPGGAFCCKCGRRLSI
jgi:hypothetical protein